MSSFDISPEEQDSVQLSKAQRTTIAVLDAGMLPHSTNERDHAYALLQPAYAIQGGKLYAERIASYYSKDVILGLPPELTLGAQLGYESPGRKALRARLVQEKRDGVMQVVADHMMDYVEDAQQNIDALLYLDTVVEGFAQSQPLGVLLLDPKPEIQRAVATLTRLYETQEYATQNAAKKSRMNTDLLNGVTDVVKSRIKEATHDLTISEVRKEIIEAIELEIGRLNFWTDQLVGHPEQTQVQAKDGESDEFDQPAVRKRYGVSEIENSALRSRITARMTAIATGKYSIKDKQSKK